MTTVQDFITNLNGTPANGRLVINSPAMTVGGVAVAASQIETDIVEGAVSVDVYSNLNAQPTGVYYTVFYELDQGPVYEENWIVPNLPTVNIGQIRAAFPQTPSIMINAQQLTSAGALPGQFLGWSGANWVPMYVTSFNYYPNFIGLNLTGANAPNLAVTGSPASLGSNFTLNVPDAGSASRGVVNTVAQTFGGNKTFANNVTITGGLTGSNAVFTDVTVTGQLLATGSSNLLIDPTTTLGDLIARGANPPAARFPAGSNGAVLTADSTQPLGLRWGPAPLVDPTLNLGDLIVRGSAGPARLGVAGTAGYVLTANSTQPLGMSWAPAAGGVPVTRVIATPPGSGLAGGGNLSQDLSLSVVPDTTNQQVAVLLDGSAPVGVRHAINFITGANVTLVVGDDPTDNRVNVTIASTGGPLPPGMVTSVFGRNGDVLAQLGDYTAAQVTNAVSVLGSYANPAWITSLAWGKLTGVPTTFPPSPHTHDASDIVSGIIAPARLGTGTANSSVFLRGDSVWAAPAGSPQTPWTSNIEGAGFQLRNAGWIGIGVETIPIQSPIAGRAYLTIKGSTDAGVLELAAGSADADASLLGRIAYTDPINNQADKRAAFIDAYRSGAVVNNRGSVLAFFTRSDGGSTPSERMRLSNRGFLGVGNSNPGYMIDAAGDVNATGCYRISGSSFACPDGAGGINLSNVTTINGSAPSSLWQAGSGGAIYYNGGSVGIGTTVPVAMLDCAGCIRSTNFTPPASGAGVELEYSAGAGNIVAYDRTAGAYKPLNVGGAGIYIDGHGSAVALQPSGGNVGIGTSSPVTLLQITDNVNNPNGTIQLDCTYSAAGQYQALTWAVPSSGVVAAMVARALTGQMAFDFRLQPSGGSAGITTIPTIMTMTGGGNVGIGTTSPLGPLDVVSASSGMVNVAYLESVYGSVGDGTGVVFRGSGTNYARIRSVVEGAALVGLAFDTSNSLAERVRISNGGNVGIGTSSPAANLDVNGFIRSTALGNVPTSGIGIELYINAGAGNLTSYNRSTSTFLGLLIQGNPIELMQGNVGIGTTTPSSLLSFGATAPNVTSRIALFENPGSAAFRGIGMAHPGSYGVGIWASTSATPTDTTMQLFVQDGGNVGIGSIAPPGVFTITNSGSQAFAYFNTNSGGSYPVVNYGLALTWNNSGVAGESNFFNTYTPAGGASFQFFQLLSASSARTVMTIDVNGNVSIPGAYKVNGVPISGGITTQTKPSRALNTVYQNTTGKPMFVTVDVQTSSGFGFNCLTDGSNPPGTTVTNGSIGGSALTAYISASFWVLPGNFYEVTGQGPLVYWTEWY